MISAEQVRIIVQASPGCQLRFGIAGLCRGRYNALAEKAAGPCGTVFGGTSSSGYRQNGRGSDRVSDVILVEELM